MHKLDCVYDCTPTVLAVCKLSTCT